MHCVAHKEDKYVDGGQIPGEDQVPEREPARARSLVRDYPAVDAIARTPARASDGGQQTGDERTASGRGATVIWTTRTTSATMETASPTNEVPWPIQMQKRAL